MRAVKTKRAGPAPSSGKRFLKIENKMGHWAPLRRVAGSRAAGWQQGFVALSRSADEVTKALLFLSGFPIRNSSLSELLALNLSEPILTRDACSLESE